MGFEIVAAGCGLVGIVLIIAIEVSKRKRLLEPRLEGTWQSDAEATIAEWRKIRPLSEKQTHLLRNTFGKMRITFEGNSFRRDLDEVLESGTFRVVRKRMEVVVIKARSSGFRSQTFKVRFTDDNTYWTFLDQTGTWECFRRVC